MKRLANHLLNRLDRRLAVTWDGRLTRAVQHEVRAVILSTSLVLAACVVGALVAFLLLVTDRPGWALFANWLAILVVGTCGLVLRRRACVRARRELARNMGLPEDSTRKVEFTGGLDAFDRQVAIARMSVHLPPDQ